MPRTARACVAGYSYHVLNRGNARSVVFHKAEDYAAFLRALHEASVRLPMPILAYCIMPNHFHLVVRPIGDCDLSSWMQWLMTTHVRRYLKHYDQSGHICRAGLNRSRRRTMNTWSLWSDTSSETLSAPTSCVGRRIGSGRASGPLSGLRTPPRSHSRRSSGAEIGPNSSIGRSPKPNPKRSACRSVGTARTVLKAGPDRPPRSWVSSPVSDREAHRGNEIQILPRSPTCLATIRTSPSVSIRGAQRKGDAEIAETTLWACSNRNVPFSFDLE
jgi:REP element-mobilizing transposase RayT